MNPGNIVRLLSGGPVMTVEFIGGNGLVYCMWFDTLASLSVPVGTTTDTTTGTTTALIYGPLHKAAFPLATLTMVPSAPGGVVGTVTVESI